VLKHDLIKKGRRRLTSIDHSSTRKKTFRELLEDLKLTYLYADLLKERELWVGDGEGAVPVAQVKEK